MKNGVIFNDYDTDISKTNLTLKIPAFVQNEFYTTKRDYGKNGVIVNYLISRIGISNIILRKYNDFNMLFIEISDDMLNLTLRLCNGKRTYSQICNILDTENITHNQFKEILIKLTKMRILFWADSIQDIEKFKKYLWENMKASAMPSEILYSYIARKLGIAYMFAPSKFTFVLTNKCNASCITCYRGNIKPDINDNYKNELSTKDIHDIIKYLYIVGTDRIKFLGGEPFCRKDIFEIHEEAHKNNMITEVSSNGILFSDDKYVTQYKTLNKVLSNLQISIDGMEHGHNSQRAGADFKKIIKAFIKLKNEGIDFSTNTIVSRLNMDELDKLIKMLASYEIPARFQIMKACGNGYENLNNIPSPNEKKIIIDTINNAAEKYNANINNSIIFHPFVSDTNEKRLDLKVIYHRCRAGTYGMTLTPQGYVLPCEFLEPYKEFICDNIKERDMLDIWHNSEVFKKLRYSKIKGKCLDCEYNYKCEMGCFSETYSLTKDIEKSDPICWYTPGSKNIEFPINNNYIFKNCQE